MELVNLRDGDPKYIKNGPVHLCATVVTATHTENQGCAKVIVLDPGVRTVLTVYKVHVEWTGRAPVARNMRIDMYLLTF